MAATMRSAAAGTVFGQPEIKIRRYSRFRGTQRLSRLIGKGRALEICLSGRRFSAEEALQWGICQPSPHQKSCRHAPSRHAQRND